MRPDDPGCAEGLGQASGATNCGMLDGRLLHPMHISDVVCVAVFIHYFRGYHEIETYPSERLRLISRAG